MGTAVPAARSFAKPRGVLHTPVPENPAMSSYHPIRCSPPRLSAIVALILGAASLSAAGGAPSAPAPAAPPASLSAATATSVTTGSGLPEILRIGYLSDRIEKSLDRMAPAVQFMEAALAPQGVREVKVEV